jgi:arginine-tRNA-protein transferase
MRRVKNTNRDLVGRFRSAQATSEQYSLFRRYLDSRHAEGGMAHMSVLDYALMVEDSHVESGIVEYRRRGVDSAISGRDDGDVVACALTDVLSDGLSMVYSFFDPELSERSLGTFMILEHIERARKLGKPYVYLGYWVDGSPKMHYKSRFKPQERLTSRGWIKAE